MIYLFLIQIEWESSGRFKIPAAQAPTVMMKVSVSEESQVQDLFSFEDFLLFLL